MNIEMQTLKLHISDDGVAHLTLDRQGASANLMDLTFTHDFARAVDQLSEAFAQEESTLRGVILRSTKSSFFAGGDLDALYATTPDQAQPLFDMVSLIKTSMRRLETLGVPVVAAIAGSALGGGWELALACHHRVMVRSPSARVGLPEVTLGLLPGGGGTVRTVRLFGLERALPLLTEGRRYSVDDALGLGLLHEVVDSEEALMRQANAWIDAHPKARQPWDESGYRIPGGSPASPRVVPMLAAAPAMLRQKTKGVYPAPEAILCSMVEGALVDFDTACRVESRYFVQLVCGEISKNMISTFWYQLNEIKAGIGRPERFTNQAISKVGVLGAGMMGAGVAYVSALRGMDVVLKDISQEQAETGKAYGEKILAKRVKRGRCTQAEADEILARIHPTTELEPLRGCDLVIEAVFERRDLKAQVTVETEAFLDSDAIFASNTSTLPITGLAKASARPEQFIGLHFFSPVDKMQLVEIICGHQTSPETLARAYDFVIQLGKTPIVVQDSRGFFTSRVFGTYTNEGMAMVGEGVPSAMIENAAHLCGFPVGPLAVSDEVSLTLMEKVRAQTIADFEAEGRDIPTLESEPVISTMLALKRSGRAAGGGFYSYPDRGKKQLWSDLSDHFPTRDNPIPLEDIKDRLLYIMALETARCLDEGVLTRVGDANVGSIFGIGFPAWTGGALQFIKYTGIERFTSRAEELASRYGDRFAPQSSLAKLT